MRRGLLLVVVLLATVAGSPVGGVTAQEETPTPEPGSDATNQTVRHVDPDEAGEDGDTGGLQSALAERLSAQLSNSSVQLSQGQYEAASELLGEEYQETYGKYVDVAGETNQENNASEFERARERQGELAQDLQSYNETREEYREAKESGNETRAQRLARDLERQAENVSRTASRVQQSYANVSEQTGANLTGATRSVEATSGEVSQQQAEVREREFERTTLSVQAESSNVSFTAPLPLEGRLREVNGAAIANQTVTLEVGERELQVETDTEGRFETAYRPVAVPTGEQRLEIRYLPNETSVYLGSNASLNVRVSQVDSALSVANTPEDIGYNETLVVSGTVTAAGQSVPEMPVVLSVDGRRLATNETIANGTYTLRAIVPATLPTGERTLRVSVGVTDSAVGPSNATAPLQVRETATNLSVDVLDGAETVTVRGTLETAGGVPLGGQTVEIRRNGSLVTTAQTDGDGAYSVGIPASEGDRYRIVVAYDEPTTNLAAASARALVTSEQSAEDALNALPGAISMLSTLAASAQSQPLLPVGAAVVLLAGGVFVLSRRDGSAEEEESTISPASEADSVREEFDGEPLSVARSELDTDPDAAVERVYRTVRNRLHSEGIGTEEATHWEFYRDSVAAGVEDSEALEALTSIYERATFGPGALDHSTAKAALDHAESLV